jgi:hypothetical protein
VDQLARVLGRVKAKRPPAVAALREPLTKTALASKVASSKTANPTKTTHHPKSNGSAKVAAPVTKATAPSKKSAAAITAAP